VIRRRAPLKNGMPVSGSFTDRICPPLLAGRRLGLGSPPCMHLEHSTRPLSRNRLVVDIEADPAVLYQAPLLSILSETAVDRRPLLDDQGR
jgi:hypothetical protein